MAPFLNQILRSFEVAAVTVVYDPDSTTGWSRISLFEGDDL
jgi:hypothetical protein